MKRRAAQRWVIVGLRGLFTGQSLTRSRAISDHLRDLYTFPRSPSPEEVRKYWRRRRARGDRAVKAMIRWWDER